MNSPSSKLAQVETRLKHAVFASLDKALSGDPVAKAEYKTLTNLLKEIK